MKVLTRDVDDALRQLFLQLQPGDPSATRARAALDAFGYEFVGRFYIALKIAVFASSLHCA